MESNDIYIGLCNLITYMKAYVISDLYEDLHYLMTHMKACLIEWYMLRPM